MSLLSWDTVDSVGKWIDVRLPIISTLKAHTSEYPAPRNLNYWWEFGFIATFMLATMIVTGIFLVMNYTPHVSMAFDSVERIMRDVNYGWLLRYLHMNGASMFFLAVYIHIFRGVYYGSYKAPRELLWMLGVLLLLLMIMTAFMGYVLPWGQMSFWAATVITNLMSAIPLIGQDIVTWLWGGFSVGNPTLNRFFSLHYLLPFVILGVVFLHLWALHTTKSNNPLGIDLKGPQDFVPFHPYYTLKATFGTALFLILYSYFVFFNPNALGHPDNYIQANPLVTPEHIVPEWYFLPYYAMLRAIDFNIGIPFTDIVIINSKLGGVIAMLGSILILFLLPWLDTSPVRSCSFRPIYKWLVIALFVNCFVLGYIGSQPADGVLWGIPLNWLGKLCTFWYFLHFLVLSPVVGRLERPLPLPTSIGTPVLGGHA